MRRLLALAVVIALCAGPLIGVQAAGAAVVAVTAAIQGSGSTWAQNAVDQWIYDVTAQNLQVNFTGSGSAQGRTDFRNDTNDFAVSDIGFQGADPSTGANDTNCQNVNPLSDCRPYVYLPIVAGGTSFPYQIRVGGKLVTNLRLSGETLAKIFTLQITNWDNSEITKDNNGHQLPDLPIIPVVDSQGSGTSAQFSRYLATDYDSIWKPYSGGQGMTEYFPRQGDEVAESGSDSIIDFVTSAAANGAIGYDEYSYALQKNWPVALVENKAGYFTAPTQYNVAVALTKAQINTDKSSANYLLQNLNNVYVNPDKRTYPLSSYSYMIIPTSSTDPRMSTPKRQALADFIDYSICAGQGQMGPIGYSPLPINLAQAAFEQMDKLHTADPAVQISQLNVAKDCSNPTFWAGHLNQNYLAHIAPEPPSCDEVGHGPCGGSSGVGSTKNPVNGKAPAPASSSSAPSTSSSASSSTSPSPGASASTGAPGATTGGNSGNSGNSTGQTLAGSPTTIGASEGSGIGGLLAVLAAAEVLLLLALPPIIARRRQQRRTGR